ncbi:uncharacterized protein LOC110362494 isoform X6 [Columba livia]|uniref:uncharacterized protein LOC110362494 isoform X6 n=1 Tax=Columba livia TaxID=8932 RepID=UPI0031BB6729
MNVRSDTGKAHSSSSRKIWEFFNCFWRCKIPSSVRNSGSTDTGNILIFQMEKLAVKALEQLLGGELSTGWLGCEFLRRSVCEQMTVFERQLDIDEALMRTEEGADGGTVLFRQQILPWSCAWCKKRPRVEKQIALLQSVSVVDFTVDFYS